jgi:hypothetical protein
MRRFVFLEGLARFGQLRSELSQIGRKLAAFPGCLSQVFILLSLSCLILFSILNHPTLGVAAPPAEVLWAISQRCDSEIENAKKSIDGPKRGFDGKTASCKFSSEQPGNSWTYTAFEKSSLISLQSISLQVGFFVSDWDDQDLLALQISADGGASWNDLQLFNPQTPPPDQYSRVSYDLSGFFSSPAQLEQFRLRFSNAMGGQPGSEFTLHLDEASLELTGEAPAPPSEAATFTPFPSSTAGEAIEPSKTPNPTHTPEPSRTSLPTRRSPTPTSTPPTAAPTTTPPSATPTGTLGASQVATFTPTSTGSVTPTPTLQGSVTLTATRTASATSSGGLPTTPTITATPLPPPPVLPGAENLWGLEQVCSYPLDTPAYAVDLNFNDAAASCAGEFAGNQAEWRYSALQFTSFTHIERVLLFIRFSITGWVDDSLNLEIFDGTQWMLVDQFAPGKSLPPSALSTLYYDVSASLNTPEMINKASIRLVGLASQGQPDQISISIDEVKLTVAGGVPAALDLPPIPTPGGNVSRFMLAAPSAGDIHTDRSLTTDSCAGCHRSHIGQGILARSTVLEELVCFSCHASNGPGTNVQTAFTRYINTATSFFKHNVSLSSGVHRLGQADIAGFSGANRHIECEDCHNPHASARGSSSAPFVQPELSGISAVDPVWSAPGAPASFNWLASVVREYQVCFKCHSSFSALPAYTPDGWNGTAIVANGLPKLTGGGAGQVADSRDLGREFNPYQASFHPVAAQGRNQNMSAASFMPGWSQTSLTYCSDCHNDANAATEGAGPHGSPLLHLLAGGQNYSTRMTSGAPRVSTAQVCFNCHNYATYVTTESSATHFLQHKLHMDNDWGVTCYTCHDTHGSEQLHLINFDASAMTFLNGRNSQTAWFYDQVTGRAGCYLSCHGHTHNPEQYTP